jgi:hypothetical protein
VVLNYEILAVQSYVLQGPEVKFLRRGIEAGIEAFAAEELGESTASGVCRVNIDRIT